MKKFYLAAMFAVVAVPVMGQSSLKLEIRDGLVNLDATAVPARQILAEWARVGGTKVVGSEKITGSPLTLKLENTPESQALDIILRNVAGYMAAPRQVTTLAGASAYDKRNPDPGLSPAQMRELQTKLDAKGHDVGKIDGVLGSGTRAAVRAAQERLGMPVGGWPTAALLAAL